MPVIKNEDTDAVKESVGAAAMDAWKDALEKFSLTDFTTKPFGINQHETESVFDYIDRMMAAMMESLSLKGITLAFTSMMGNHFITSKGTAAPIRLINHDEWNELNDR